MDPHSGAVSQCCQRPDTKKLIQIGGGRGHEGSQDLEIPYR